MKKLIVILMAACLLCASCAALADFVPPAFDSMPRVILEDEDTTLEESSFEGEWVLNIAFAGTEYVDESTLFDIYDYNFMPYRIAEGKITQDLQNESGEFVTVEMPYTFENGQLLSKDRSGREVAVELLEDGNIVMSVFFPGEGDTPTCLSVFLKHPEE